MWRYARYKQRGIEMEEVKFERNSNLWVKAIASDGGSVETQSVEAHLMLAILEKLEEIRCGIIDVESAVDPR
jgi:hypothetical protein